MFYFAYKIIKMNVISLDKKKINHILKHRNIEHFFLLMEIIMQNVYKNCVAIWIVVYDKEQLLYCNLNFNASIKICCNIPAILYFYNYMKLSQI